MSGLVGSAGSKSGVIGTTELDYEEGTFTPYYTRGGVIVAEGTGTNQVTYSVQKGIYTKIGKLVVASIEITITADVLSDGLMGVSLPFTAVGTYHHGAYVSWSRYWGSAEAPTHAQVYPANTHIEFIRSVSADARDNIYSSVGGSSMTANSQVRLQATYRVA